jgi:hypothetical protein
VRNISRGVVVVCLARCPAAARAIVRGMGVEEEG